MLFFLHLNSLYYTLNNVNNKIAVITGKFSAEQEGEANQENNLSVYFSKINTCTSIRAAAPR